MDEVLAREAIRFALVSEESDTNIEQMLFAIREYERLKSSKLPSHVDERLSSLGGRYKTITLFVFRFIQENGYPPTNREIVDGTDITSTSVVNYYVRRLVNERILEKDYAVARGLRIAEC